MFDFLHVVFDIEHMSAGGASAAGSGTGWVGQGYFGRRTNSRLKSKSPALNQEARMDQVTSEVLEFGRIRAAVGDDTVSRRRLADGLTAVGPLLHRLGRFAALTPEEIERVARLAATRRRWTAGTVLFAEGRATGPHFVISGWACGQRVLRDGRRQIFDFVAPGEGFGFGPLTESEERQSIVALTSMETIEASGLLEGGIDVSAGSLWRAIRAARVEANARSLDHMVRLGQLTAYEKAAHFLLEMRQRAGVTETRSFPLPLTQEVMADALGLSVVHLNRVLRQLRADGLADIRSGVAIVNDRKALAAAAVLPVPAGEPILGS